MKNMTFSNLNFFTTHISIIKLVYQILKILLIALITVHINAITYAEMHINIVTGNKKSRLIAIIPFYNHIKDMSNKNNISDIIASDLCNSGKFHSLSPSQFPEKIQKVSDISTKKWLNLGVNMIILGDINVINNDKYLISYQLIDLSHHSTTVILKNQYTVPYQWIRYAAHNISNDIFEQLTSIKGIFSTRIAYIIYEINNEQYPYKLYISDYDGYNPVLIHRSKEPLMSPTWSPSGDQLVYVLFEKHRSMLVIHDLKKGVINQLISAPQHNGAPCFSPDGKQLAFVLSKTGSLNLYVMDLFSNTIRQITNDRSNNTEPSWFPDNKTLSYTSDQSGSPQIYKINTTDINNFPQRLSWSNSHNQNGHISKDGKFLIMISRSTNNQNITKLDLSTEKCWKLTDGTLDETFTLAPNDNMIIYNTSEGSESKLYLFSMDNNYKVCLKTHHKEIRFPTWSPYIEQ